MQEKYSTSSQAETEVLGEKISKRLKAGDIVAFSGGLGAGKTAFSRGVLRGFGYTENVTSPTFSIVNEYRGKILDAAHFDMYRIESEQDLYSTGFYDYLDGNIVVLIEWSENIPWAIEDSFVKIDMLENNSPGGRDITIEGLGQ